MSIDPSEYSVKDLREEVKGIDDPEQLQDVMEAEREEKDRKTARRAIERRLDAISTNDGLRTTALEDAGRASDRLDAMLSGGR